MSILKDWNRDKDGMALRYKAKEFFSPAEWKRLHKWRKQRANRGWSDRDAWGAGEHIARITAEMLQHLHDKSYTDWPEWFKHNITAMGEKEYTDLPSVIADINNYLDFAENESWADGITTASENMEDFLHKDGTLNIKWVDEKTGRSVTEAQIRKRMEKHVAKEQELYSKAKKAMQFFGRHFAGFWD